MDGTRQGRWRGGRQRQWRAPERAERRSGWRQRSQREASPRTRWELFDFGLELREAAAAPAAGRYEGSVRREADGSTFLRAIELGATSGNRQAFAVFDQVGGGLPSSPQHAGDANVAGQNTNVLLFSATDSVASRRYLTMALGDFLFSFSQSIYHDGRPEVKLAGALRRVA